MTITETHIASECDLSLAAPEPRTPSPDERLARLARRLLAADGGMIYRRAGDRLELRAVDGLTSEQLARHGLELECPPVHHRDDQGGLGSTHWLSARLAALRGQPAGCCCVWSELPRQWSAEENAALADLAALSASPDSAGREQPVRHAVTRILNEASTVSAALPEVLRVIAELGGWDFGAYWTITEAAAEESLRCDVTWRRSEAEAGFEAAARRQVFRAGEGLPGQALDTRRPIWSPSIEVDTMVRRDAARQAGLRSAYAFPIIVGEVPLGALEFFSRETRESDAETLRDSAVLGGLLGQFIQRRRAQQALLESEEQLRLAMDAGRLGAWTWDVRTNELHWSETLQRLHGIEPNAFPGDISAFLNDMHPDDRERVMASVQGALAGGADHHVEYRIVRPDGTQRWVLGMGRVAVDQDGAPRRMSGVCMDITERKRSELAMEFLAEASIILAASLDCRSTLAAVARLATPTIADWCAVDLLADDGTIQRLAVAHTDPEKVQYAYELQRRYPTDPDAAHGVPQVLRTGKPEMMSDIPDSLLEATAVDAEHLAIARSLGLRSYLAVPLTARGRVFGAITLVSAESGRRFGEEELALAEELARRAAVAIDNARLFQEAEQAEVKLRNRLEFIHAVTHSLEEGILAVDGESRIIFVNPAAEAKLGYDPGELMGKPVGEVLRHRPAADDADRPLSLLPASVSGARTHRAGEAFLRRDGSEFPVAYTYAPLRTGEANPGAVLLFEDVTEQRLAEAERARQAREAAMVADVGVALNRRGALRELLVGCTDAVVRHVEAAFARVWTLNDDEEVLELQASSGLYTHLDGPHSRVPVGSFKIGLIARERRPHLTNDVSADPRIGDPEWARRTGMVSFAGYPLLVEDRLVGVLALFARRPLADDTLSALGAIADILAQGIERKRGEDRITQLNTSLERRVRERTEALLEANRELESFSYSVSHDLRAPLRHVLGFADMLDKRSGALLDENGRRYLRTIQESARHAGSLVDDLLAFSRMGRAELRQQRVAMDALVKQAQQDVSPELESRECAWSIDALPEVEGDAAMLRLVWRNLLSNAVKYTRGREIAEIRVSAEATPEEVVFTVRDNGVGFDMRYVDKLFGVFQRLHTSEEFEGTGIGLANVRRIVQRHGGRAWAEGVPGEGAAFHFSLPRNPRTAEPQP